MSMMKDDLDMPIADKRQIQFQKYREGELPSDVLTLSWDVDAGNIEEVEDVF